MADVHIGRIGGLIRVAATPGESRPAFARAVLDVAGAVLTWPDVTELGLPTAEIHDVEQAQQWLWAVYGERVAAAVHARSAGKSDGVRVTAEAAALAGTATRLAFGHWAARWWPASYLDETPALEPDLLGLELAALTYQCQQLFDGDEPDDCAALLIDDHRAAIDDLVQWWRGLPGQSPTARSVGSVLRLVDAAADNAGLDGPALRRLRSAVDQPRPGDAPVQPGALFSRRGDFALAAGEAPIAGGREIARGTGDNDWRRYPPGFVDAAEDAVTWLARAVGGRRQIEITAVAGVAAPATGVHLAAEFRVDGGPPDRIRLNWADDVWTGRAELEVPVTGEVRVDVSVLLPGFDPGPGGDVRADREAVRDVARRRLTAAAQPVESATGPFLAEIVAAAGGEDF